MSHKKKVRLIILVVVAALAVVGVAAVFSYNHIDHSIILTKNQISEYNSAITLAARSNGSISSDEFVLVDRVTKELGGNTEITFRVYKLPEGAAFSDFQDLRVRDVPAVFAPEHMANGTARLVGGTTDRIIVNVAYVK